MGVSHGERGIVDERNAPTCKVTPAMNSSTMYHLSFSGSRNSSISSTILGCFSFLTCPGRNGGKDTMGGKDNSHEASCAQVRMRWDAHNLVVHRIPLWTIVWQAAREESGWKKQRHQLGNKPYRGLLPHQSLRALLGQASCIDGMPPAFVGFPVCQLPWHTCEWQSRLAMTPPHVLSVVPCAYSRS